MAKKKRSPLEVQQHRAYEMELALQGYTGTEIAELVSQRFGVSITRQQVQYDLSKVRQEWRDTRLDSMDEIMQQELLRLDILERELWKALHASVEPTTEKKSVSIMRATTGMEEQDIEVIKSNKHSAAIFSQIHSVQQERRKLLGLYKKEEKKQNTQIYVKGFAVVNPGEWPQNAEPVDVIEGQYEQNMLEG